jgi:hypothetical protein
LPNITPGLVSNQQIVSAARFIEASRIHIAGAIGRHLLHCDAGAKWNLVPGEVKSGSGGTGVASITAWMFLSRLSA